MPKACARFPEGFEDLEEKVPRPVIFAPGRQGEDNLSGVIRILAIESHRQGALTAAVECVQQGLSMLHRVAEPAVAAGMNIGESGDGSDDVGCMRGDV